MATDNSTSTYPYRNYLLPPLPLEVGSPSNPSIISSAVLLQMPAWEPIDICTGGTFVLRANAEKIIPKEPKEDQASYERRIFHATMPPFLLRLASQAAGIILRKGIEIEGDDYWEEWCKDVTGDGQTLDEYARNQLITALLYGHSSSIVDYGNHTVATSLAEERQLGLKPYLVPIHPTQILGWRTKTISPYSELTQVRMRERIVVPNGEFGERLRDQIRVMEPGKYQLWRTPAVTSFVPTPSWTLEEKGETSLDRIPLVTVYSQRKGNLISRPPLLEVAHLCIAYAQRFCDYHHSIHVGANPMLVLRGFDPDTDVSLGISVNTALALPPEGGAEWVQPTSDAFDSQLKCLKELEDQISRLGINTLTQANLTNAAAEARRIDRIDSDSIMAVISGDLERSLNEYFAIAAEYVGIDPPTVYLDRDYDNRVLDGNTITSYLQLYMQGAISQYTLLKMLQDGEVLPSTLDIDNEIAQTRDQLAEQQALMNLDGDSEGADDADDLPATYGEARGPDMAFQRPLRGREGPVKNAGQGLNMTSQTLPTPLRPGKYRT